MKAAGPRLALSDVIGLFPTRWWANDNSSIAGMVEELASRRIEEIPFDRA